MSSVFQGKCPVFELFFQIFYNRVDALFPSKEGLLGNIIWEVHVNFLRCCAEFLSLLFINLEFLLMFLGATRISRLILDLFKFDLHIIVSLELSLWFFTILSSILGIFVSTLNEYYVSSVNLKNSMYLTKLIICHFEENMDSLMYF